MLTDSDFLIDVIEKAHKLAGRNSLCLSSTDIAQAMRSVYYASIRREEGEKVLPHLTLVAEQYLPQFAKHIPILTSSIPEVLSPELLRKRTLAFDRKSSSFLATPTEKGLSIRGVAHWSWRGDSTVPRSTNVPILRFDAEDAGTVLVCYDRTKLGVFRDGNFYASRGSVFANSMFKRTLLSTFSGLQTNEKRAEAFITSLDYIVRSAMSYGFGGTIIVIDDRRPSELSEYCESGETVNYSVPITDQGHIVTGMARELLDDESDQVSAQTLLPARKAYLEFVSRLICIDGALILSHKLQPLRYGTKLHAPASTEDVFLGGDPDHRCPPILNGVGTRHSSTLNLVSFLKNAVAFTISSDGPVSAFGWIDGRLSWWKNAIDL